MERWNGSLAIVTGCAAGIGLAVTKELIKHNIKVFGLDKTGEKLEALEKEFPKKFYGKKCDLNNIEEILSAFKYADNKFEEIPSILVNNAGILSTKSILDVEEETITNMLQVNVRALIICNREAAKRMINKKIDGHIVNISSATGESNPPIDGISPFGIYTATKHAVSAFSEDLRRELFERKTKIKVSTISPGFVNTDMGKTLKYIYGDIKILEPADVAKRCIDVLNTPPDVLITSIQTKSISEKY